MNDIFIQNIDFDGNFSGVLQISAESGFNTQYFKGFTSVYDNNSLYSTGNFIGTVDFDPGTDEVNFSVPDYKSNIIIHKLSIGTLGLGNTSKVNSIGVYPNPTNGKITIDLNKSSSNVTAKIFNSLGKLITA